MLKSVNLLVLNDPLDGPKLSQNCNNVLLGVYKQLGAALVNYRKKELPRFGIPELNYHVKVSWVYLVKPMDFKQQKL